MVSPRTLFFVKCLRCTVARYLFDELADLNNTRHDPSATSSVFFDDHWSEFAGTSLEMNTRIKGKRCC